MGGVAIFLGKVLVLGFFLCHAHWHPAQPDIMGLMTNVSHRLMILNTGTPAVGAVWGGCGKV